MKNKTLELKWKFFDYMQENHKDLWEKYQHFINAPSHASQEFEIYDKHAKHVIQK